MTKEEKDNQLAVRLIEAATDLKVELWADAVETTKPGDTIRSYRQENNRFIITGLV